MNRKNEEIDISIWMTTYFHESYVEQAIKSVLMQKTTYSYEIVICDDCSQDGTWAIVEKYARLYPNIIRARRNVTNLGLSANVLASKKMCRGRYIVNLSGDDYWLCDNKIQMQADFLEDHPDYVGVGTKVELRYDELNYASGFYPKKKYLDKEYTKETFEKSVPFPSHGFMMRNIFLDEDKSELIDKAYAVSPVIDDIFDPFLFLKFGKLFVLSQATSAYRLVIKKDGKHNFNSSMSTYSKAVALMDGYVKFYDVFGEDVDLRRRFTSVINLALLNAVRSFNFSGIGGIYRKVPMQYKKPWYKSVAVQCIYTIIPSGINYVKGKLGAVKALKERRCYEGSKR